MMAATADADADVTLANSADDDAGAEALDAGGAGGVGASEIDAAPKDKAAARGGPDPLAVSLYWLRKQLKRAVPPLAIAPFDHAKIYATNRFVYALVGGEAAANDAVQRATLRCRPDALAQHTKPAAAQPWTAAPLATDAPDDMETSASASASAGAGQPPPPPLQTGWNSRVAVVWAVDLQATPLAAADLWGAPQTFIVATPEGILHVPCPAAPAEPTAAVRRLLALLADASVLKVRIWCVFGPAACVGTNPCRGRQLLPIEALAHVLYIQRAWQGHVVNAVALELAVGLHARTPPWLPYSPLPLWARVTEAMVRGPPALSLETTPLPPAPDAKAGVDAASTFGHRVYALWRQLVTCVCAGAPFGPGGVGLMRRHTVRLGQQHSCWPCTWRVRGCVCCWRAPTAANPGSSGRPR
jgi:hypothetical protein